ncbi:MAG: ceramidase domain-containing protein [Panacagrimonas sp.]
MNWQEPVDLYCERLGPGLFAEPFNALSNLSFIVAGFWLAVMLPRVFAPRAVPLPFNLLAGMIVLIGIGSGAFHTFALKWAELMDVLSIALFVYSFVICFARYAMGMRWALAWIAAPVFWAFGLFVTAPFDAGAFNGSVGYFPALAGIGLMAFGLGRAGMAGAGLFRFATFVFIVSIGLRSVDQNLCAVWPFGTHWAWHLLNGLTLSLVTLGAARAAVAGR